MVESLAALLPGAPRGFVDADADLGAASNQRQTEQPWISPQTLQHLGLIHAQVRQPCIAIGLAGVVQQGCRSKAVTEAAELSGCHGTLRDINEADLDTALLEEAQAATRGLRIVAAEDLDGWRALSARSDVGYAAPGEPCLGLRPRFDFRLGVMSPK